MKKNIKKAGKKAGMVIITSLGGMIFWYALIMGLVEGIDKTMIMKGM